MGLIVNQSDDGDLPGLGKLDGKKRMIDCTQGQTGNDDNRKIKGNDKVDDQGLASNGDQKASDALHQKEVMFLL